MLTRSYQIAGMCCEHCITHVQTALESLPEIESLKVQIEEPQAVITLKSDIEDEKIIAVINNAGHYSATGLSLS